MSETQVSIFVVVIFILFLICIRIRNVFLLLSFVFRYYLIYGFRKFFFLVCIYLDEELNFFTKLLIRL